MCCSEENELQAKSDTDGGEQIVAYRCKSQPNEYFFEMLVKFQRPAIESVGHSAL